MKYIALDIGNVICYADLNNFVSEISDTFNVPLAEAARWLKSFQQVHDLGQTTMDHQLRHDFGCKSETTIERLIRHWSDLIQPSLPMVEMLDELNEKHDVQIALLSNIGIEHAAQMEAKLNPLLDYVGARKPTLLYYQSFLLQHPEFKGCLYVDDLQENLDASKKFGFRTHHFALDKKSDILEIKEILLDSDESDD